MQLREGCAGQRIEGLAVVFAAVALQSALSTPAADILRAAMAAAGISEEMGIDQLQSLIGR